MEWYKGLVYPLLKTIDAETTHDQTLHALSFAQSAAPFLLRAIAGRPADNKAVKIAGLTFPNILGIAAGFDKDVRVATGLAQLGFGHIEAGTLTPRPQKGNPRPRIFRLPEDGALINRMGFPNGGVLAAVPRLQALNQKPRDFVLGVSLGKQKETPLADAAEDYCEVMSHVYEYADYLAINISSPNTPGLRELQTRGYLGNLLGKVQSESQKLARQKGKGHRPLFLKIAPDISDDSLEDILFAAQANDVDGIIATNTTISREGLQSGRQKETGGLSGLPLKESSTDLIKKINEYTDGKLPIIGVGGVRTAADVRQKLQAGATLVQLYTGLIYEGPAVAGRILRELNPQPLYGEA